MNSYDVYVAAPLFNEAERQFNLQLTTKLEVLGLSVFLPQRDGLEFAALEDLTPAERNQQIFALDAGNVASASVIVAVLDGRVPDEGVCVELGIGWAHSRVGSPPKLLLGLKTDQRGWLPGGSLNPMIAGALDTLFDTDTALLDFVAEHLVRIKQPRAMADTAPL